MSFEIQLKINPRAAIRAGKSTVGIHSLTVTDDDLAGLDSDEREELANVVLDKETIGDKFHVDANVEVPDAPLAEATFDEVHKLLQARVKARNEYIENLHRLAHEEDRERKRIQEQELVAKRQRESNLAAQLQAIHRWVEEHGSDGQKKRLREGLLSDKEILTAVREQLFEPLDIYAPYTRMHQSDVCRCACENSVKFEVLATDGLDEAAYTRLLEIRNDAPKDARVLPRRHLGSCDQCDCPPVSHVTALVELDWHTAVLGKEFELDD